MRPMDVRTLLTEELATVFKDAFAEMHHHAHKGQTQTYGESNLPGIGVVQSCKCGVLVPKTPQGCPNCGTDPEDQCTDLGAVTHHCHQKAAAFLSHHLGLRNADAPHITESLAELLEQHYTETRSSGEALRNKDYVEAYNRGRHDAKQEQLSELKSQAKLVEALADYAHEAWSEWMLYLFTKCGALDCLTQGTYPDSVTIPQDLVERWWRQINTKYPKLSHNEKQSDRDQAQKIIRVLVKYGLYLPAK